MVVVILALSTGCSSDVRIPEDERLSIYAQALHFQASRIRGPVNLFRISTGGGWIDKNGVPFQKLQPSISHFAAPTVDGKNYVENSILVFADFRDVIDSMHAVVDVGYLRDHSESSTLVFAKRKGRWFIDHPKLSTADLNRLYQSAFLFLLGHKDYGYEKETAYAAILSVPERMESPWMQRTTDPPAAIMPALWRRGYSLKYASEIPDPKPPGHPPPHTTFYVGDVIAIDPARALIQLRREHFSAEPGYNDAVGPSNAEWTSYLAIKKGGNWKMANMRFGWYPDPAE